MECSIKGATFDIQNWLTTKKKGLKCLIKKKKEVYANMPIW